MSNTELLPCAHCGGKAELKDYRLQWAVDCTDCNSSYVGERAAEPQTEDECDSTDWTHYEQTAIYGWNTRDITLSQAKQVLAEAGLSAVPVDLLEKLLSDNMRRSIGWRSSAIGDLQQLLQEQSSDD